MLQTFFRHLLKYWPFWRQLKFSTSFAKDPATNQKGKSVYRLLFAEMHRVSYLLEWTNEVGNNFKTFHRHYFVWPFDSVNSHRMLCVNFDLKFETAFKRHLAIQKENFVLTEAWDPIAFISLMDESYFIVCATHISSSKQSYAYIVNSTFECTSKAISIWTVNMFPCKILIIIPIGLVFNIHS